MSGKALAAGVAYDAVRYRWLAPFCSSAVMCTYRDERLGASRRCRVRRSALPVASVIPLKRSDVHLAR
jgi:hypothetical protein